jgi:hypothetical protein
LDKIIRTVKEVPAEKHTELLKVVEEFKNKTAKPINAGKWERFFGIITDEQAETMLAIIERECEQIENGD